MSNAFDKASLVMLPHAYEEGKVYSLKPTDRSGDFTFSRGTDTATRVGEDGYIKKEYVNKILGSNDWAESSSRYTITGGEEGYDGSNDAWLVTKTNAGYFSKANLVYDGVLTASIYAKAGTLDRLFVFTAGESARFDLTNGTSTKTGGALIAHSIEPVGNDWYRCSMTFNKSETNNLLFKPLDSSNQEVNGTMYVQDGMLNYGLVAYPYVETTTAPVYGGLTDDMPRLDYSGGATCPSLLLEPQRTNDIAHSEYINSGANATISYNDTISPEGVENAIKVTLTGTYQAGINTSNSYVSVSTTYTQSCYVKKDVGDYFGFGFFQLDMPISNNNYIRWDLSDITLAPAVDGSYTNGKAEDVGNGWIRLSATITTSANSTRSGWKFLGMKSNSFNSSNVGDSFYLYGIQAEPNATYPTSYIPTYGSSQTRAVDDINRLDISSLAATYQTLFIEASVFSVGADQYKFSLNDATGSRTNRFTIFINNDDLNLLVNAQGSSQPSITQNNYISANTTYKIAAVVRDGSYALFANGTKIGEQVGTTPSNLNSLTFGDASSPSNQNWEGNVNQALVFPTALSDSECIALTTL